MLTEKQWAFVAEVERDPSNRTEAARRAGYAVPDRAAGKLRHNQEVEREIERRLRRKRHDCGVEARDIVRELTYIAFLDPLELVNGDGTLKDLRNLPEEVRRAVQDIEVREHEDPRDPNRKVRRVIPKEMYGKPAALRQIAELLGYLRDKLPQPITNVNTVNQVVMTDAEIKQALLSVVGAARRGGGGFGPGGIDDPKLLAAVGEGSDGAAGEGDAGTLGSVLGEAGDAHGARGRVPGPVAEGPVEEQRGGDPGTVF